jgi:DNA-binding LytR/AlgR family response regulator
MKILIVEDEKLSSDHLKTLLHKIDSSIIVIDSLESIKEFEAWNESSGSADLILMDIHLADGISFEIFEKYDIDIPIIFTTAYNEYAIKAFKVNSVDYLLKPIGLSDLSDAIEKFKKFNQKDETVHLEKLINAVAILNKQYKQRFLTKMGEQIISIKTEEIGCFTAEDRIVLLKNKKGQRYPVDYTLDQLESLVDPSQFFRINRKAIVNINHIEKVSTYFNNRLKISSPLLNDEEGIVSRDRVAEFKQWLNG